MHLIVNYMRVGWLPIGATSHLPILHTMNVFPQVAWIIYNIFELVIYVNKRLIANFYGYQIATIWTHHGKSMDSQDSSKQKNYGDKKPQYYAWNNLFFLPLNHDLWVWVFQGIQTSRNFKSMTKFMTNNLVIKNKND